MVELQRGALGGTRDYRYLHWILGSLRKLLYKVGVEGRDNLSSLADHLRSGVAIVYFNHVFLADAPIVVSLLLEELQDRLRVIAAPSSRWHYDVRRSPAHAVILRIGRALGVHLFPVVQHYDRASYTSQEHFRLMKELIGGTKKLLSQPGTVVLIAPEGTRAAHSALQEAQMGIVHLARHNPDVWLMPVGVVPQEAISRGLNFGIQLQLRFGNTFQLSRDMLTRGEQSSAARYVMHRLAELLPERMRGVYGDVQPPARSEG